MPETKGWVYVACVVSILILIGIIMGLYFRYRFTPEKDGKEEDRKVSDNYYRVSTSTFVSEDNFLK